MDHLIKITLANLPKGKINLSDNEILDAMMYAVKKEMSMGEQLLNSREKMETFSGVVASMAWDKVHA